MGKGRLRIQLAAADNAMPVGGAEVLLRRCGPTGGDVLYTFVTDENGNTPTVELDAPPRDFSLNPNNDQQAFGCYDVEVACFKGFRGVNVRDVQVFEGEKSILPVIMHPNEVGVVGEPEEIIIPREHGLDANDHGNNPFPDIWPDGGDRPGEVDQQQFPLANEVQIPEFITVHLGRPNDSAPNVRVRFSEYIKNVASSEIYPTWERAALEANIHAQISFALNRVYTQWYRSRGFTFDITNSTEYVKKW